jgi:hypothetical protein
MTVQAVMLVRARSDYEYMVPIYGEAVEVTFILRYESFVSTHVCSNTI